jgi:hypothetical protein
MEKIIKRWASVEQGIVTNVVLADEEFANQQGYIPIPDSEIIGVEGDNVSIGWQWTGFRFTPPPRDIMRERVGAAMQRDALLAGSDAFIANDLWMNYTDDERTAWAEYRQALRNILETYPDPVDIVWPESPNG